MGKTKNWSLQPELLKMVATRFRVLAEPIRLQILQSLETGELSVTDITNAVESTQPNVSKHLKILQDSGLLARRQEGNTVFYSIADKTVFDICDVVCASLKRRASAQSAMFR